MRSLVLREHHQSLGARFDNYFGWELPKDYGNAETEYDAARSAVALMDRSYIGKLSASGKDRIDLLQRLSTNDLRTLENCGGTTTVLTSEKGRIIDYVTVYAQSDYMLMLVSPQNREKVRQWIDKYTIMDDVHLTDVTEQLGMLSIFGPKASAFVQEVCSQNVNQLAMHHWVNVRIMDADVLVARTMPIGGEGFNLIVGIEHLTALWEFLLQKGRSLGVTPLGQDAYEILRIEEGIPMYDKELSEKVNPLEAGLESAVSFTKGCYIGQEVIARLDSYHKLQRHLIGFVLENPLNETVTAENALVKVNGDDVGWLTSVGYSLRLNKTIALGYLKLNYTKPETLVQVIAGEKEFVGKVKSLPFFN
jgi:glycine cleavage system T protein